MSSITMNTSGQDNITKEIANQILNGKEITKVAIVNEWRDDHLPCVEVELTLDGEDLTVSVWWCDLKMWHQAECNHELDKVLKWMKYDVVNDDDLWEGLTSEEEQRWSDLRDELNEELIPTYG